jgi:hypothetical protein
VEGRPTEVTDPVVLRILLLCGLFMQRRNLLLEAVEAWLRIRYHTGVTCKRHHTRNAQPEEERCYVPCVR